MASANRGAVFQQIDRLYRDGTLSGLGDGQLLERYLSHGDEAAFEALVNLHGPMVLGLCRRVLRDPRDIEDAFQATFLILVRKAPTIRDRGLLSNWLYGVAYRVARRARSNTLRRRDREIAVENLEATAAPEPADILGIGTVLDQELNRLPRKYRSPLILCYLDGRTHDQAAAELGCPVGTVRSRLARGRDLLRRRLTSRGHAPTAAILGGELALPAKFITDALPPSLLSDTVRAAIQVGVSKTIQAGAASASALALTQGVLTTMKLAQLKIIGTAIVATSLSAGGVIAISYGSAQTPKGATDGSSAAILVPKPQEKAKGRPFQSPSLGNLESARFEALEQKVDELLKRLGGSPPISIPAGNTTATPKDPFRGAPASTKRDDDARRMAQPQHRSIQELEVELKLELERDEGTERLFRKAVISPLERELSRGKVLLIKATLAGRDDELSDEIERLKLEINTKRAEARKDDAQTEAANFVVARNHRLNDRKPGMVSAEDVAKARVGHEGRVCSGCDRGRRDRGDSIASATIGTATCADRGNP